MAKAGKRLTFFQRIKTPFAETQADDQARLQPRMRMIGDLLRERREDLGLDLDEIGTMLRIKPAYLAALEQGRTQELPGPAYAIGFVRAYADFLGLDSEQVLARFKAEAAGVTAPPDLALPVPLGERSVPGGAVVVVALILGLCGYGVWYYHSTEDRSRPERVADVPAALQPPSAPAVPAPAPPSPAPGAEANGNGQTPPAQLSPPSAAPPPPTASTSAAIPAPPVAAPSPPAPSPPAAAPLAASSPPAQPPAGGSLAPGALLTPMSRSAAPNSTAAAQPAAQTVARPQTTAPPQPAAQQTAPPQPPLPSQPVVQQAAPPSSPAPQTASSAAAMPPAVASAGGRITIKAVSDCWIQVRAADQSIVFSRVLRAGETYTVPQRSGLSLRTGNAGALELAVDGKAVPSIGGIGALRRDVQLDPTELQAGTAVHG